MIFVVGESPGGDRDVSSTDMRLASILDISPDELIEQTAWVNLWPHVGSDPKLYVAMVERAAMPGDLVVLLGRHVASEFLLDLVPPLGTVVRNAGDGPTIMCLPHPSGRNRWWNDPKNEERAAYELQPLWRAAKSV